MQILLFLLAIVPIGYIGWLIFKTGVNILYVDDWGYIFLFHDLATHTLNFHDLIAQHNESRPLLPVLIILGVASQTHWDVRWEMWIELGFACLVSINIYLLSRRLTGMSRTQRLFLWVITNVLLFSAEQSQNWTFGIQMIFFMPMLFISAGMLVAYSRWNVMLKFALCAVLATAATFSHAIGQVAWIVLLPPLFVGSRAQSRRFGRELTMWAIVCAANLWLYYRDYYKPPWHPSLLLAWKYPVRAGQYFTAFLGAPLAQGYKNVGVSILFGIALLACLVMACVHLWRIRKQEHIADSATAWLVLCAFALASAFTATLGRMGFGIAQSQDSRYTGFSVYLVIGLLYLGAMVVRDVYRRGEILSAQARSALGLALVLIPHVTTEIGGYRQMWADRRVRLAGKAYTQLLNLFPSPQGVYMTSNVLTEKDFLDQMGYLRPGLVKSRDLTKIAGDASIGYGYFDALTPGDDSTWSAIGWATIPYRRDPAEVVLLAGEDGSGAAIAFAEGLSSGYRPDVARTLRNADYELSGWGFTFKSSDVPPGTRSISAWVYDPETGKAQRIGQTWGFMRKR